MHSISIKIQSRIIDSAEVIELYEYKGKLYVCSIFNGDERISTPCAICELPDCKSMSPDLLPCVHNDLEYGIHTYFSGVNRERIDMSSFMSVYIRYKFDKDG